jgi:hypothetical protein
MSDRLAVLGRTNQAAPCCLWTRVGQSAESVSHDSRRRNLKSARWDARRAFDGCADSGAATIVAFGGIIPRPGDRRRPTGRQITPLRMVPEHDHRRAYGKSRRLGTGTADTPAGAFRRGRKRWFRQQRTSGRVENAQVAKRRGYAGAFHPAVLAPGSGLRGQNRAEDHKHEPCHGGRTSPAPTELAPHRDWSPRQTRT